MALTPEQNALIDSRPGWCGPNKRILIGEFIAKLLKRFRFVVGCEIGVYGGQSLLSAAYAIGERGVLYGVDPYLSEPDLDAADVRDSATWWQGSAEPPETVLAGTLRAIEGLPVKLIRKRSQEAIDDVPTKLNYLHIDGDHAAASAQFDLAEYGRRVVRGGMIVVDDVDWAGVQTILPELDRIAVRRVTSMSKKKNCSAWSIYEVR